MGFGNMVQYPHKMSGTFQRLVSFALRGGAAAFALALCIHGSTKTAAVSVAWKLNLMGHRRDDARQDARTGLRLADAERPSGADASGVLLSPVPSGDFACPIAREAA